MRVKLLLVVAALSILFAGCKKKDEAAMAPMGEAAPAFGQQHKDLSSFVVGSWCAIDPMGQVLPKRYYEFKADGTFETGIKDGDWKSTGKWSATPQTINLTYETMKGKSFEAFRAEYKKDEEGGGQVSVQRALVYDQLYDELAKMNTLWVEEDGKHLTFSQPTPPQPAGGMGEGEGGMDNLLKSAGYSLERMEPKKGE